MSIKKLSSILFVSKVVKNLFDMASIMILSRILLTSDYGIYRQVLLTQQLVVSILTLGIPSSAIYYLSSSNKRKEYLINLYISLFSFSILVILVSPFLANLFDANFKTQFFKSNLFIIALLYSLGIFSSASENILIALNKTKNLAFYTLLPTIFWFIGLLSFSINNVNSLYNILFLLISRYVLSILLLIISTYNNLDLKFFNLKRVKEIIVFGIPMGLSSIIGILNRNIDKLVVGYFVDNANFAVFSNGAYEIPFLSLLTASLFTVLIPEFKKHLDLNDNLKVKELWIRSGSIMITIIIPLATSLIFFSKPFVLFLFSEKYLASVPYFRIYQLTLYLRIYVYGTVFLVTRNNKLFLKNAFISLIFNLVFDILLVIKLGPIGAVVATVLTKVFLVFLHLRNIKNILNIKFSETFPWSDWIKSIIITIFISSVFYIIFNMISKNIYVGLFFMALSFMVSFYLLSKLINDEILNYIISILKIKNIKK